MNSYINAQILNMIAVTKTFVQACEMAAMADDGKVSKEEERNLKRIKKAAEEFQTELKRIQ